MTFGEKLLELRRCSGMSQDVLAEKLEVSRQAVSKWERDEAMPETDKVVRIAQLFGVSLDELLLNKAPEKPDRSSQELPPQPQRTVTQDHSGPQQSGSQRLERFIRRHGYKGGYLLAGAGVLTDLVFLIFRAIWRNAVSSMTGSFGSSVDAMFGGSYIPGFGMEDPILQGFNQATQQMSSAASDWGNIFLIGLIPGTALITLGVYVIIKGKQIAKNTSEP